MEGALTDPDAQERERLFADRWSGYGAHSGILHLSKKPSPGDLRRYEIFQPYDEAFLETLTPDISVATWKAGAILFEEGSYLDRAFYVIDGAVDVYLKKDEDASIPPIFDATRVLTNIAPHQRSLDRHTHSFFHGQIERQKRRGDDGITYLSTMDFDLPRGQAFRLGPGEIFGEIGALNGWPQSVTARAATECTLVQIRVPALRRMKKKSSAFNDRIDAIYRERTLVTQLKSTPPSQGSGVSITSPNPTMTLGLR